MSKICGECEDTLNLVKLIGIRPNRVGPRVNNKASCALPKIGRAEWQ
jgi:hypothetical protein